jgi:hypothetical protein
MPIEPFIVIPCMVAALPLLAYAFMAALNSIALEHGSFKIRMFRLFPLAEIPESRVKNVELAWFVFPVYFRTVSQALPGPLFAFTWRRLLSRAWGWALVLHLDGSRGERVVITPREAKRVYLEIAERLVRPGATVVVTRA